MAEDYIPLEKLDTYKLSRELSKTAWKIYEGLNWEDRKIAGYQFVESTDSVGANISEGYGRFHFLDRAKFYLNARGSLLESQHWFSLLEEREKVGEKEKKKYLETYTRLRQTLNGLVRSTRSTKSRTS